MTDRSAHANQTGMLTTGQRRRLGAWLLLGWATFWLMAVIEPCCRSFAVTNGSDKPTPLLHAAGPVAHHVESPSLPSRSDTDCPDLSAAGPGIPNAVTAVTDRPDFPVTAPSVPLLFKPYGDARALLTSNVPHPPLSGAPLYLRTQRFRI